MLQRFARRFSPAAWRFLRSRDGAVGLLLSVVAVVCLFALQRTEPARLKSQGHKAFEVTAKGYAATGSKQNPAIKDGATKPDRQQQIARGTESDLARFRNFFFKIGPWVIGSLLAIRFGYFSSIKKLGKLVLVLLCAVTVIVGVGSEVIGRTLKSLGVGNTQPVEIVIIICTVVVWLMITARIVVAKSRTRHAIGAYGPSDLANRGGRPTIRFSNVGGMDSAKEQIRRVVQTRLKGKNYHRYGVVQNGIYCMARAAAERPFLRKPRRGNLTSITSMWPRRRS